MLIQDLHRIKKSDICCLNLVRVYREVDHWQNIIKLEGGQSANSVKRYRQTTSTQHLQIKKSSSCHHGNTGPTGTQPAGDGQLDGCHEDQHHSWPGVSASGTIDLTIMFEDFFQTVWRPWFSQNEMLCLGLGPGFPRRELESPTSRPLRQRGRWPGKVPGEGNGFQHPRHQHGPFDSQSSPQSGPQLKDSLATQVCKIQENWTWTSIPRYVTTVPCIHCLSLMINVWKH